MKTCLCMLAKTIGQVNIVYETGFKTKCTRLLQIGFVEKYNIFISYEFLTKIDKLNQCMQKGTSWDSSLHLSESTHVDRGF